MELIINHEKKAKQFVAWVEGKPCILDYAIQDEGKTLDYYSTFVPPELRGRGIAENIVRFALEYAKDNSVKVIPSCPFVQRFIERHPEYRDVVNKL